MDIWPIFLLAAGLIAFIIYLAVVVSRLFFIKKQAITFGTASLLFISFVLVASSFYMVLTEKNGILSIKNMALSKTEQLNADGKKMQELTNANNKMKADSLEGCLQSEAADSLFEESPFQIIDVSMLEGEWEGQEENLFTEWNILARFSLGDDDFIIMGSPLTGNSEGFPAAQSKLDMPGKDVLKSCLSKIGEME